MLSPRPVHDVGSSDLAVSEAGLGDDLVVFLHGVLDRGQSFARVADILADECRTVWYDRRGYGQSVDAAGTPVGFAGHVADLMAILAGRRAVVVGHSFGGVTALAAAIQAPHLIPAVVIYETGMAWVPGWDDRFLAELLWADDAEERGAQMMFRDQWEHMSAEQRGRRVSQARAFVAEERSVRTGVVPFELSDLEVPLVYGCGDEYRFPVVADYLRRTVDRLDVITLAGADHNAHRTRPDGFADLVRLGLARAGG